MWPYMVLVGCFESWAVPSPSLVHRWENGQLARLRSGNLPRDHVVPYWECCDPNPEVLLFVCLLVSICLAWIKYTNTDSNVGLRPNPSWSWKDYMKGRCERWVWKHCGHKTAEEMMKWTLKFRCLGKRAWSNGLICLCGLRSISSPHT